MSRVIVGRIFWKELRTQRSLWIGVLCLTVIIQTLIAATALLYWRRPFHLEELLMGTFFAAYAAATAYAIASGAASFTEEIEGNTRTLLQTVPVTRWEAFTGKWLYGLASTGVLFLVLAVVAGISSGIVLLNVHDVIGFSGHGPAGNWGALVAGIGTTMLIPIEFFAFCALFSLLMTDGLMAALCGSMVTVFTLIALRDHLSVEALVAVVVIAVDFWLTDVWLRRGALISSKRRWQWTWPTIRFAGLIQLLRIADPVVPWRRTAQRLLWKELRQAWPYFGISVTVAAGTAILSICFSVNAVLPNFTWPWIMGFATPLVMGVAAYHVDQKGRAYRFHADRGLSPDGSWIVKHVVWLGLTFAICGLVLALDEISWEFWPFRVTWGSASLWVQLCEFGSGRWIDGHGPHPAALNSTAGVSLVVLYVTLAYSIGQWMSFTFAKGMTAFGLAMMITVLACIAWTDLVHWRLPVSWTIGAIPVVLLTYTWMSTQEWQIQQPVASRWPRAVLWITVPLGAISLGLTHYWIRVFARF